MICGIITGGKFAPLENIEKCDYIIACDLGYKYCLENNIKPNLLIGDFDSYEGQLPLDIETITLPVEKDDTDTMYAYRIAIEKSFDTIYLYCALGNRLDHTIANIQTCSYAAIRGVSSYVYDEENYLIVTNKKELIVPFKEGYSLSLFALADCKGVSIKGTKYEADNVKLSTSFPIGQSNDWKDKQAIINVDEGIYMIVNSKM